MEPFRTTEMDLTVTLDEFWLSLWCFYIAVYITSNNCITNSQSSLAMTTIQWLQMGESCERSQ